MAINCGLDPIAVHQWPKWAVDDLAAAWPAMRGRRILDQALAVALGSGSVPRDKRAEVVARLSGKEIPTHDSFTSLAGAVGMEVVKA